MIHTHKHTHTFLHTWTAKFTFSIPFVVILVWHANSYRGMFKYYFTLIIYLSVPSYNLYKVALHILILLFDAFKWIKGRYRQYYILDIIYYIYISLLFLYLCILSLFSLFWVALWVLQHILKAEAGQVERSPD